MTSKAFAWTTSNRAAPSHFGFRSRFPRPERRQNTRRHAQAEDLNRRIAEFYDNSSGVWEDIWGEHMHHGIYRPENPPMSHKQAQLDLIEEVLDWANVKNPKKILDVGCGIGGSARYLAQKYQANANGVTLSPIQMSRAKALTRAAGLNGRVSFDVCDALNLKFADNSFDFIWSLESGEHMPNKRKFVSEMMRVCEPGGQIVLVTWCHRRLKTPDGRFSPLNWQEDALLKLINAAYALPDWVSIEHYEALFQEFGLEDVKVEDWSSLVEPFWGAVIRSALTLEGVSGLLKAGPSAISGAVVMPLMQQGFRMNTIKFNLITGTKKAT